MMTRVLEQIDNASSTWLALLSESNILLVSHGINSKVKQSDGIDGCGTYNNMQVT